MSGPDPLLEARDLAVSFGKQEVLNGISIDVARGEIVVLVGHNGAGKSTTLRAIYGLHHVTTGRVKFDGRDITNRSPRANVRDGMRLVPQGVAVFGEMTVTDNLELAGYGLSAEAYAKGLHFIWEFFPLLRERAKEKSRSLSGGQQQILALAMGLIAEPRLLMLDEPCSGLAPTIVTQLLDELVRVNKVLGTTIVLCEQNVRPALRIAHTAHVLRLGRVVARESGPMLAEDPGLWRLF